jgi:hypothetical protein
MYEQCLDVHKKFTTEASLLELLYVWDTQKNESINNFVRGRVPKDSHYARMKNWEGRVMTAANVDSLGYEEYHRRVCPLCAGLEATRYKEGLLENTNSGQT